jgi:hypothetical protein
MLAKNHFFPRKTVVRPGVVGVVGAVCAMFFHVVAAAAVAAAATGAVSLAGWTTQTGAGSTASISSIAADAADGADAEELFRVNFQSPERSAILVAPPKPVPLPDDIKNLSLRFARTEGDFTLSFRIRDANGATHEIKTNTSRLPDGSVVGWQQNRVREWSLWSEAVSYRLDVPADVAERTLPEFRDATRAKIWKRPLALAGILLKPASRPAYDAPGAATAAAVRAGRGALLFSAIHRAVKNGFEADFSWRLYSRCREGRDTAPVLFPDDLTSANAAEMRYEVTLQRGYQGDVVWRRRGAGSADRENPAALFRQRIRLPFLPEGRYFLNTKTWKPDGTFIEDRLFLELVVMRSRAPLPPPPLAQSADVFQWHSDMPSHVFPQDTREAALRLSLPATAASAPDAAVHVRVVDYDNRVVMNKNFPRPANGGDLHITLPVEPGGEYFAIAGLVSGGGRPLDRAPLHFGVASPPEPARGGVPDSVPGRDAVLSGNVHYNAEYWTGDRPSRVFPWVTDIERGQFEKFLEQAARAGARSVSIGDLWGNHEMLPGVFQWRELDRRIALAATHGLKTFLAYTADGSAGRRFDFPLWLDAAPRLDQAGATQSKAFAPGWWDPAVREGWLRYYKRLVEHVRGNPDVIGYRLSNYQLAAKTAGWGVDPFRIDYSAPAQREFAKWTAGADADTGAGAGADTGAGNFRDAKLGVLFSLPGVAESALPGPDFSRDWRAFVGFATYSHHARLADFFATIRSLDSRRQIQVDQKPFTWAIERFIPHLRDGGVLKNEDSPSFNAAMLRSMCAQAGVPYAEEFHNHMPTSRSIADVTCFWHSLFSGHLFWLMRWRPAMVVRTELGELGEMGQEGSLSGQQTPDYMLDYMRETLPAWEEWIRAGEFLPQTLVLGSRTAGLLGGQRSGGEYEIDGARVFSVLFRSHQVPAHFADEHTTGWTRFEDFRVVFVCGEIMTAGAIGRVVAHARAGGKIVVVGDAGKYCPDRPGERNVLGKALDKFPAAAVRRIAGPRRLAVAAAPAASDIPDWQAAFGFDEDRLAPILEWAGVVRRVTVAANPDTPSTRFECQVRAGGSASSGSGSADRLYVAVMRTWAGGGYGTLLYENALKQKYGLADGKITVNGLKDGAWRVEKFHRTARDLGTLVAVDGTLGFASDPALAGEVQLFRLTRLSSGKARGMQ